MLKLFYLLLIFIILSIPSLYLSSTVKKLISVQVVENSHCIKAGMPCRTIDYCFYVKGFLVSTDRKGLIRFLKNPNNFLTKQMTSHIVRDPKHRIDRYKIKFNIVEVAIEDRCILSNKPLNPLEDVVLEIKGVRFPFKKDALPMFLTNPDKYVGKFLPRSALVHDEMEDYKALPLILFYIGIYVLLGLIFGALTSKKAISKGKSAFYWFFMGFVTNILGYILISLYRSVPVGEFPHGLHKIPVTTQPKICPQCRSENHPSKDICYECGARL